MAQNCMGCGKEIGIFYTGKMKIAGGVLCRNCAEKYEKYVYAYCRNDLSYSSEEISTIIREYDNYSDIIDKYYSEIVNIKQNYKNEREKMQKEIEGKDYPITGIIGELKKDINDDMRKFSSQVKTIIREHEGEVRNSINEGILTRTSQSGILRINNAYLDIETSRAILRKLEQLINGNKYVWEIDRGQFYTIMGDLKKIFTIQTGEGPFEFFCIREDLIDVYETAVKHSLCDKMLLDSCIATTVCEEKITEWSRIYEKTEVLVYVLKNIPESIYTITNKKYDVADEDYLDFIAKGFFDADPINESFKDWVSDAIIYQKKLLGDILDEALNTVFKVNALKNRVFYECRLKEAQIDLEEYEIKIGNLPASLSNIEEHQKIFDKNDDILHGIPKDMENAIKAIFTKYPFLLQVFGFAEKYEEDDDADDVEEEDEIINENVEITETTIKIQTNPSKKKCANCGNENKENAKFCHFCGNSLLEDRFCMECGKKLRPGKSFCSACGANNV